MAQMHRELIRAARRLILSGGDPTVNRHQVGISYSGGGPMLLAELGVAKAVVESGIVPNIIAGVSAGAITAAAHALDPIGGRGIKATAEAIKDMSDRNLGLTRAQIVGKAIREGFRMKSLGDNSIVKKLAQTTFEKLLGESNPTFAEFGYGGRPQLLVGATDLKTGKPLWFPPSASVPEALVASSAIPGMFPPYKMNIEGQDYVLVDGGVSHNQPLSVLALAGCGTIFSCSVSYYGAELGEPSNGIDTVFKAISIMIRQAVMMEEEYVRLKLGSRGIVHRVHPPFHFPVRGFNWSASQVDEIMGVACAETLRWIKDHHMGPSPIHKLRPSRISQTKIEAIRTLDKV